MDFFKFTVPAQSLVQNPQLETNIAKVKIWVDQLPYADPIPTARILLNSIQILNRNLCPLKARHELLECYRKAYWILHQSMRMLALTATTTTYGKKQVNTDKLLKAMTREFAFGYKTVLNELLDSSSLRGKKTILHSALLQSTQFLVLELITAYMDHAQYPSHVWRELHTIYRKAEENQLEERKIVEIQNNQSRSFSLSQLYKQACLLALLDPYQHNKEELWSILYYTDDLAEKMVISSFSSKSTVDYTFMVNLFGENPPTSVTTSFSNFDANSYRLLDTRQVVNELKMKLHSLKMGTLPQLPHFTGRLSNPDQIETLLQSMRNHWRTSPRRKEDRASSPNNVWLCIGLESISNLLKKETTTEEDSTAADSLIDYALNLSNAIDPALTDQMLIRCSQSDSGEKGIGLTEIPLGNALMQVNQVIAFQTGHLYTPESLSIGIVQWIRKRTATTLSAGIKTISSQLAYCTLALPEAENRASDPAIMLQSFSDSKPVRKLLVPPGKYFQNQLASLQFMGHSTKIILGLQVESNQWFECFEIIPASKSLTKHF
ncbi:MAG: hypothetical protein DRQ61_01805 [Gammaproteobacteria bacterium]|nr:MAG: hypothetical protein DRQ56_05060 [Gammaproteobacteria bacterium]RLA24172.1 MAG: hypothetical protein DRQ61_01805 [Gammaproteobacteria bacterium]